jgi:hypothetical protein
MEGKLPVAYSWGKALALRLRRDTSANLQGLKIIPPVSICVVGAWLALIGAAIWSYAAVEVEPPVWDVLTYAMKASNFWEAVAQGRFFNPLDLQPIVRPPGTILVSYPFGFSHAFTAFYFRSVYLPILLLAAAVYIACHRRDADRRASWATAVIALALCGMPILYQFEGGVLPAVNLWGLVDTFMAGVAAISVAAAVRSVRMLSPGWAIASATAAALCLMIKPAGLLVMALVGATWLILIGFSIGWKPGLLVGKPELRRFVAIGSVGAAIICGLAVFASFSSAYLSADTFAWGERALAVLHKDFATSLNLDLIRVMTQRSLGYVIPPLMAVGLILALSTGGERGHAVAATLCLGAGVWFWLIDTDLSQVRYFLPFASMTFVIVAPSLVERTRSLPTAVSATLSFFILTPTIAATILILLPQPPVAWQRALYLNLSAGTYRAENKQGAEFLEMVQHEGARTVYMLTLAPPAQKFAAVVDYWTYFDPQRVRTAIRLPVDWSRSTTYRLNEIGQADFVLFELPLDDASRRSVLQQTTANDFAAETRLIQAWFSTLGADDGVAIVSETRLRLLRVVDRERFRLSLDRLRHAYDWRPVFLEANP